MFFILFLVGKFGGRYIGVRGLYLVMSGMTFNAILWIATLLWVTSAASFDHFLIQVDLCDWLNLQSLKVTWLFEFTYSTYLITFMILIVFISVMFFSFSYMQYDPNLVRFFSYLSVFVGFMLLLINAGNFIVFFTGWEGVGLSSFLLINFWTTRLQTCKSAFKALLINRIGDFSLLLAFTFLFKLTRSLDFQTTFILTKYLSEVKFFNYGFTYIDLISFFLLIAAMSKSAQAGLHIWLPDAMEGPTPVSAMIHAATMVTAGLFLLLRCSTIIIESPTIMFFIMFIGASTAVTTSILGAWRYDIKKIIAFSTCSQLGYIMSVIGASQFSLGFFHLLTHGFFKSLLFLVAGGIIHVMQGEQDLRRLSGSLSSSVIRSNNLLHISLLFGSLTLSGVIFFSGYYSKESILNSLITSNNTSLDNFVWAALTISIFFTSYYSFRILHLLFANQWNSATNYYWKSYRKGLDRSTRTALIILVVFSIIFGYLTKTIFLYSTLLWDLQVNVSSSPSTLEFVGVLKKNLPILMILLGFLAVLKMEVLEFYMVRWKNFSYFILSKFFYDNLLNKLAKVVLVISYKLYLALDKGLLEWLGPYGIYKYLQPVSRSIDIFLFNRRMETSFLGTLIGILFFLFLFSVDILV